MGLFGKKKTIDGNKIEKLEDGTMEVTISFDPFNHGHDLGAKRNYNKEAYQDMVENEKTQARIANGYAIGYYSHNSRNKREGYTPSERDSDGNEVMPICKTLFMKWEDSRVIHKQRILNNAKGTEIQKLITAGVGGFSSVHNLKTGSFLGFDYVVSPNFSSNRAVVDNACENGVCELSMDSINLSLSEQIDAYIRDIGGTDDDDLVKQSILKLEKETKEYKSSVSVIEALHEQKIDFDAIKTESQEDVEALKKEHSLLVRQMEIKHEEEIEAIESVNDDLLMQIEKLKQELLSKDIEHKEALSKIGIKEDYTPNNKWSDVIRVCSISEQLKEEEEKIKGMKPIFNTKMTRSNTLFSKIKPIHKG